MSWNQSIAQEFLDEYGIVVKCNNKKNVLVAPVLEPYEELEYDEVIVSKKNPLKVGDILEIEKVKYMLMGGLGWRENWRPQIFEICPVKRLTIVKNGKYQVQCDKKIAPSVRKNLKAQVRLDKREEKCLKWAQKNQAILKSFKKKFIYLDYKKGIIASGDTPELCQNDYFDKHPNKDTKFDMQLTYVMTSGKIKRSQSF